MNGPKKPSRSLASVYHLKEAMGPYRDAGVGQTFALDASGSTAPTYMVMGYRSNPQEANSLRTYPCQGSTEVDYAMGGETPNPFVGTSLFGTVVGQPIYFSAPRSASRIEIASISIEPQNAANGARSYSLAEGTVHLVTQASDPNRMLKATEAFAVPKAEMLPSTTYRVRGTVLVDGTAQTVDFSFATGIGWGPTGNLPKYIINPN